MSEEETQKVIRPQPGSQEAALACTADVLIYGGSAGSGKSHALLMEPLRYAHRPGFNAAIFRRTYPELTNLGGLWPESKSLYGNLRFDDREPVPKETTLEWIFPSGARVKFGHMQHEEDRFSWKGAQVPLLEFDQVESFTEQQFWYMLSRNRDPSGTCLPYVRTSCNPVPEDDPIGGWLCRLIAWWIDQETGYPVEARNGVLRWFVRIDEELEWADSREALVARYPDVPPKSLTFIRGRLEDNKVLLAADPNYRANLMALSSVERERLLSGNWKVREAAGKIFHRSWFRVVPAGPQRGRRVRYWDKAGTEGGTGARTAGVRMAHDGRIFYVEDVVVGRWSSLQRNRIIRATAELDGPEVEVWVEQEPGSGGKESAETTVRELAGYGVRAERVTGDKVTRAAPLSAQAEAGNVVLVSAGWNAGYLAELHAFPDGGLRDQCVVAGTLVRTISGDVPIERIEPGDLVMTRHGYRRVLHVGLTRRKAPVATLQLSDGRTLTGTHDHPVWFCDSGFRPLIDASSGVNYVLTCEDTKPLSKRPFIEDSSTTATRRPSRQRGNSPDNLRENVALRPVLVSVVHTFGGRRLADVYNLTVDGDPEFFANGVLVHNCDASSGAFNKLARGGGSLEVTMGPRDHAPAGLRTTLTVRAG